jgi:Zn-dependent M28 family amino/carboxypeptidase
MVAILSACAGETTPTNDAPPTDTRTVAIESVSGTEVRAHMELLGADDMYGREAGTQDYDRAAAYVADQFRLSGLLPMGNEGSYFQSIEFFETRLETDSAELVLHNGDSDLSFTFRDDFIRSGGYGEAEESITAPLIFVGHGISAPEYGHDDFAGVDIDGTILVMLSGAPPQFATDQRAFYSSSRGKAAHAAQLGAIGIISVRTPVDQARRPWSRYLPGIGTPGMRWIRDDGVPHQGFPELAGSATLSESGAEKLFAAAGHDLEAIFEKHATGETGSFDLGLSATLKRRSMQRTVTSANVVGLLKGSDPALQNEYIVYTAHLDHIGVREGEGGDDIHNGAYDNAAGVAVILEIAAGMAVMETPPQRSIIFAAVTAEEKGLQGSSFFAHNPPVPIRQLVANINIDMPYLAFPVADVQAFGAEHSTLLESVTQATSEMGMGLTPDPMPEEVRFVRSDQFSFVQEGVPALAFKAGTKSFDQNIDGDAMLADFLKNHYHRASDDLDLPYSPEGAERFAQAALLLGLIVAEDADRPRWKDGDFFGDKFARRN